MNIYDAAEAQATILRRRPWEDQEMPPQVLDGIERIFGERLAPAEAVARILADVRRARRRGAASSGRQRIDGDAHPAALEIPAGRVAGGAYERLSGEKQAALDLAAARIAAFHRKQPMDSWVDAGPDGTLGQLIRPLDSVGRLRAWRHRAAALVAAHGRHPGPRGRRGPGDRLHAAGQTAGSVPDLILAAAYRAERRPAVRPGRRAGHRRAWPTARETVPRGRQDRRRGRAVRHAGQAPGDRQRGHRRFLRAHRDAGDRRRDALNPAWAAADLLAQAEHDVLASPILLTPSPRRGRGSGRGGGTPAWRV